MSPINKIELKDLDVYTMEVVFSYLSFDSMSNFIESTGIVFEKHLKDIIKKTSVESVLTSFTQNGIFLIENDLFDFKAYTKNMFKYVSAFTPGNSGLMPIKLFEEKENYELISTLIEEHPKIIRYIHPNVFKSAHFKKELWRWEDNPYIISKIK